MKTAGELILDNIRSGIDFYSKHLQIPIEKIVISEDVYDFLTAPLHEAATPSDRMTIYGIPVEISARAYGYQIVPK